MTTYYGETTVDGIECPLPAGTGDLTGEVRIRVTVQVDEGYRRDSNGDGCPPSESDRDYEVIASDLWREDALGVLYPIQWDALPKAVRDDIGKRYLWPIAEELECCEYASDG